MITYKGFKRDMTCREFQYEEGKEYETDIADACHAGFHACEYPLDCLRYYSPNSSEYHIVKQSGELSKHDGDTKIASTKIKIGAKISIAGLVKAAIEYTRERINPEAESNEVYGTASATGDWSTASATGDWSAASATGNWSAASVTGYKGVLLQEIQKALLSLGDIMEKQKELLDHI